MMRGSLALLAAAAACVLVLIPLEALAQAAEPDDEKRCSVSVRAYRAPPPTYDGGDRRNPDGSVYPGDAVHYVFVYRGLDTCISFSVGGLKSFGSAQVREHEISKAVSIEGLEPGEEQPPPLQPRTHSHSAYDLSVTWDEDENVVVWGEASAPHGRHGDIEYEDESSKDALVERAEDLCTSERKYAGCAWGHVEIPMDATDRICLHDEAKRQDIRLPEGVPDECRDRNYVTMGVEGTGRSCKDTADGRVCTTYTRTSTATVRIKVLDPLIELGLTKPPLSDVYGFDSQNLDGTYYLQDPVHVVHEPVFKWKEARGGVIDFVTTRHWYDDDDDSLERMLLPIAGSMDCAWNECGRPFAVPGTTPTAWQFTNGDGQTAYSAPSGDWLGTHLLSYKVDVYNIERTEERLLNSTKNSTTARIVVFDPVFGFATYPVLADDEKYGHENRFALASWYGGSWGGGPGDANMTGPYEYRRARMDTSYGAVAGYNPANLTTLSWNLAWSEAPRTPARVLEYGAQDYPGVAFHSTSAPLPGSPEPLSPDGAAMWPKTGYGRIFFDFPDIAEYRLGEPGSRHYNATAYAYTMARDFAGEPHRFMASGLYTYPDTLFHQKVTIRSVDSEGNIKPLGISLASEPRRDLGAIPLTDYIHEKMLHDTNDAGFADLAVHDTYPMDLDISTESGYIDAKVRRTASLFVKASHDAHQGDEVSGGPGPLLPFMLALPGANQAPALLGPVITPGITGPNPAEAGLEGLFGLLSQVVGIGDAMSGVVPDEIGQIVPEGFRPGGNVTTLPRPDIEALMLFQNMSMELGYGGLAEITEGTYMAFPDTSRMNFPLSYGLATLSPLNVTLGTDFYSQGIDHRFGVTEGSLNVTINTDKDNVMLAERKNGILSISYDENFGAMLNVAVNGSGHGRPAGSVGVCAWGCDMYVGWGSLDVTAYNKWGGEARHHEEELERPPPPPPPPSVMPEPTYDEWLRVLALAIFGLVMYRLVYNRLANGVWSIRA